MDQIDPGLSNRCRMCFCECEPDSTLVNLFTSTYSPQIIEMFQIEVSSLKCPN